MCLKCLVKILIVSSLISCDHQDQDRDYIINKKLEVEFYEKSLKSYHKIDESFVYKIYDDNEGDSINVRQNIFVEKDKLFNPNKLFNYKVIYTLKGDTLSNGSLSIKVSGKRWPFDSKQREIIYKYDLSGWSNEKIVEFQKKKNYPINESWVKYSNTGIIETTQKIWMHPPRQNEFKWLELTPFPEVRFPLKVGKTYSSSIITGEGWGDFSHKRIYSTYIIDDKIAYHLGDTVHNSFIIKARSKVADLTFESKFVFSADIGFLEFTYHSPYEEELSMRLKPNNP